jgi:hypothetical protein
LVCDIVIRSYFKDFRWLDWCLRSVQRFCVGFRQVVLVVPASSRERLEWRGLAGGVTFTCPDYRDDYLGQQVTKLSADEYTDADYICHVDSDCVFTRITRPEDLFEDGRPRVTMAPYATLDRYLPWQPITEAFLGDRLDYEFMRTPPYTFPRWLYAAVREHSLARHGVTIERYVLDRPPRGFSEINALTGYAYLHAPDALAWHDVTTGGVPEPPCRVYWSWGGIDARTERELTALLGPAR